MFVLMCVCVRVCFCVFLSLCVFMCLPLCACVYMCVSWAMTSYKISREVRVPAVARAVRS